MAVLLKPRLHRFSKNEYHQMHDLGFFVDQCVELIDGEVIDMPAPGHSHCVSTDKTSEVLRNRFGRNVWVRVQMPLNLTPHSEPLPDVAVVAGARDTHTTTPTMALLLVEVSETSLADDRGRKASLFAASGISDYWIVNLPGRQLEIHRKPVPDATEPFGYRYDEVTVLGPSDVASPLALPNARIQVSQLLP
jgi:Uma2 family endonuclease